jgi:hypothetical protein
MNRYPWPEMQVGEVREITSDKPINVIRSAASMYSLKQQKREGIRPVFSVTYVDQEMWADVYRIERKADRHEEYRPVGKTAADVERTE